MKKGKGSVALMLLLFTAGVCVLLYPAVSSWLSARSQTRVVQRYSASVEELQRDEAQEMLQRARAYNAALNGTILRDPFSTPAAQGEDAAYEELLNVGGVMGYVEIPEIHVDLPVYHGVSDAVLQKGLGHLYGTGLPVGGVGNHAVLTGHTGLPNAEILTNLDRLALGDRFSIHVLGEVFTYEVDQIKVVEPEDTRDLQAVAGRDYLTLLTCTPYGVNSHRLLVRGERVDASAAQAAPEEQEQARPWYAYAPWLLPAVLPLTALIFILRRCASGRRGRK